MLSLKFGDSYSSKLYTTIPRMGRKQWKKFTLRRKASRRIYPPPLFTIQKPCLRINGLTSVTSLHRTNQQTPSFCQNLYFLQAFFSLLLMIKLSCLTFLLRFKYMNLHYRKILLALKSEQLLRRRGFVSKSFQNS